MMPPEGKAMLHALGATIVALPTVVLLAAAIVLFPSLLALVYLTAATFGLALVCAIMDAA